MFRMEKQAKLIELDEVMLIGEAFKVPVKPKILVNTNTYMTSEGLVREQVIRKTWLIPTKKV